jgi:hypothetical protein
LVIVAASLSLVADHVTVVGHGVFFSDKARGLFVTTDHGGGKRRAGIIISHARPQNGLYAKPPLTVECVRFIIVLTPNSPPSPTAGFSFSRSRK